MTPTPEEVAALVNRLTDRCEREFSYDSDCDEAAAALTALQARAEAAEARVREVELSHTIDKALIDGMHHRNLNLVVELKNAVDEANACGAERATWKERAEKTHEAMAELVEEVDFFLRLFSVGKPVHSDRLQSSAAYARAALTPAPADSQ